MPTRRPLHGRGRHIDYGICDKGSEVEEQGQTQGVADHDLVWHDISARPLEPKYCYNVPRFIRDPTLAAENGDNEEEPEAVDIGEEA